MQKIKVSHESPIAMLSQSKMYNDYDYCLVHLMETHEEYRNFFVNARNVYDREVLLDNSIFELGTAFDSSKYMEWAEKINPNLIIIPDVLENSEATKEQWKEFNATYKSRLDNLDARRIGVVQGKDMSDLVACYKFMSAYADVIALSFDMSYYDYLGIGATKLERMSTGRPQFIKFLIDNNYWNWNKPVHLLGCSLPQEFSYYVRNNIHNIRSVDTSNPIVHGLYDIQYNSTLGLKSKVKQKLADLIEAKPANDQMEIINYNISQFREIVNGSM